MNCPKCNSPLKEGDKFCQICGTVVGGTGMPGNPMPMQQPMQQPIPQPTVEPMGNPNPTVAGMPMPNQQVQPQQFNQGANVYNPQPDPVQPQIFDSKPAKKVNGLVIVMGIIIVLLVVIIVIVLLGGKKDNGGGTTPTNGGGETPATPVVQKYTETQVNGYKMNLPKGYSAEAFTETEGYDIIVFDEADDTEVAIGKVGSYKVNSINKENIKAAILSQGYTEVSYAIEKINGKQALVYTLKDTSGYKHELIYIESSSTMLLCAEAAYYDDATYTKEKDNVRVVVGSVVVNSTGSSYNSKAGFDNKFSKNVFSANNQ